MIGLKEGMKPSFLYAFALIGFAAQAGEITPSGLADLPAADVIILGEVHDNPVHHQNQTRAVSALRPTALVFEMLTPDQAAKVTPDNRGNATKLAAALGWQGSGWPDFAMYYPVFDAAPKAQIYGGGLPRAKVRRAVSEGAAVVFGDGAAVFGLSDALPAPQQSARELLQKQAHCNALPENLLPGMVEAQRLRDATLAAAVIKALKETAGPVIVITGNGHARADWGVPALLDIAAAGKTTISVGQFEQDPWDEVPFDFYLLTSIAEREDPCAAFIKKKS